MKRQLLVLCFTSVGWTQSRAPAFEAASIRSLGPTEVSSGVTIDSARIRIHGFSLKSLILEAYQIDETRLVGPTWLSMERYVIEAAIPQNASPDQLPSMLQSLLAERFILEARRVSRVETVYAIVPNRGGTKLRERIGVEAKPPPEPIAFRVFSGSLFMTVSGGFKFEFAGGDPQITSTSNGLHLQASRISSLVKLLSLCADKPVVDRTKLNGSYQIELDVTDEQVSDRLSAIMAPPGANAMEPPPIGAGSMRQMLRGLGLTVENRTEPVDTLIIDRIEKAPTPN